MNTLDNLILFILVAVLLYYCYKKKKFPFSKLKKGETAEPTNTASVPNIYPIPHIQYPTGMYTPVTTRTYCKLVGADNTVLDSDSDIEHVVNTELQKLISAGNLIQGVSVVSYTIYGTDTEHILFCITYSN